MQAASQHILIYADVYFFVQLLRVLGQYMNYR